MTAWDGERAIGNKELGAAREHFRRCGYALRILVFLFAQFDMMRLTRHRLGTSRCADLPDAGKRRARLHWTPLAARGLPWDFHPAIGVPMPCAHTCGSRNAMPRSPESQKLMTRPGMTFDVSTAGRSGDPLVLMLHGFCASRYSYDTAITDLACHGYYAVAPNQRGYSPGARPDPSHYPSYRVELLVGDAMEIAGVLGYTERRFHLVGHDWGASLAWEIAARYPERLASLTILSRPHPLAFNRALETDTEQAKKIRTPWAIS
jgi:hypothetical protein